MSILRRVWFSVFLFLAVFSLDAIAWEGKPSLPSDVSRPALNAFVLESDVYHRDRFRPNWEKFYWAIGGGARLSKAAFEFFESQPDFYVPQILEMLLHSDLTHYSEIFDAHLVRHGGVTHAWLKANAETRLLANREIELWTKLKAPESRDIALKKLNPSSLNENSAIWVRLLSPFAKEPLVRQRLVDMALSVNAEKLPSEVKAAARSVLSTVTDEIKSEMRQALVKGTVDQIRGVLDILGENKKGMFLQEIKPLFQRDDLDVYHLVKAFFSHAKPDEVVEAAVAISKRGLLGSLGTNLDLVRAISALSKNEQKRKELWTTFKSIVERLEAENPYQEESPFGGQPGGNWLGNAILGAIGSPEALELLETKVKSQILSHGSNLGYQINGDESGAVRAFLEVHLSRGEIEPIVKMLRNFPSGLVGMIRAFTPREIDSLDQTESKLNPVFTSVSVTDLAKIVSAVFQDTLGIEARLSSIEPIFAYDLATLASEGPNSYDWDPFLAFVEANLAKVDKKAFETFLAETKKSLSPTFYKLLITRYLGKFASAKFSPTLNSELEAIVLSDESLIGITAIEALAPHGSQNTKDRILHLIRNKHPASKRLVVALSHYGGQVFIEAMRGILRDSAGKESSQMELGSFLYGFGSEERIRKVISLSDLEKALVTQLPIQLHDFLWSTALASGDARFLPIAQQQLSQYVQSDRWRTLPLRYVFRYGGAEIKAQFPTAMSDRSTTTQTEALAWAMRFPKHVDIARVYGVLLESDDVNSLTLAFRYLTEQIEKPTRETVTHALLGTVLIQGDVKKKGEWLNWFWTPNVDWQEIIRHVLGAEPHMRDLLTRPVHLGYFRWLVTGVLSPETERDLRVMTKVFFLGSDPYRPSVQRRKELAEVARVFDFSSEIQKWDGLIGLVNRDKNFEAKIIGQVIPALIEGKAGLDDPELGRLAAEGLSGDDLFARELGEFLVSEVLGGSSLEATLKDLLKSEGYRTNLQRRGVNDPEKQNEAVKITLALLAVKNPSITKTGRELLAEVLRSSFFTDSEVERMITPWIETNLPHWGDEVADLTGLFQSHGKIGIEAVCRSLENRSLEKFLTKIEVSRRAMLIRGLGPMGGLLACSQKKILLSFLRMILGTPELYLKDKAAFSESALAKLFPVEVPKFSTRRGELEWVILDRPNPQAYKAWVKTALGLAIRGYREGWLPLEERLWIESQLVALNEVFLDAEVFELTQKLVEEVKQDILVGKERVIDESSLNSRKLYLGNFLKYAAE